MSFNRLWGIFWEYRDVLLTGIEVTVVLSIVAMLLAVVIGLVACLGTLARSRFIRAPAIIYVESFVRRCSCSWAGITRGRRFSHQFDDHELDHRARAAVNGYLAEGVPGRHRVD